MPHAPIARVHAGTAQAELGHFDSTPQAFQRGRRPDPSGASREQPHPPFLSGSVVIYCRWSADAGPANPEGAKDIQSPQEDPQNAGSPGQGRRRVRQREGESHRSLKCAATQASGSPGSCSTGIPAARRCETGALPKWNAFSTPWRGSGQRMELTATALRHEHVRQRLQQAGYRRMPRWTGAREGGAP